jgi:hypothetical protein
MDKNAWSDALEGAAVKQIPALFTIWIFATIAVCANLSCYGGACVSWEEMPIASLVLFWMAVLFTSEIVCLVLCARIFRLQGTHEKPERAN